MHDIDALEDARNLLQGRLADLNEERHRLERALAELNGKVAGPGRSPGPGRTGNSSSPAPAPRKRRKRRGGTRADQAVKLIESRPGINASDIAKSLKIKPNYVYQVLGALEKEGRLKKQGRQYHPKG